MGERGAAEQRSNTENAYKEWKTFHINREYKKKLYSEKRYLLSSYHKVSTLSNSLEKGTTFSTLFEQFGCQDCVLCKRGFYMQAWREVFFLTPPCMREGRK